MNQSIEKLLPRVQKPGRYVGGELHSVVKKKEEVEVRFAFCFPDTYEVGDVPPRHENPLSFVQ